MINKSITSMSGIEYFSTKHSRVISIRLSKKVQKLLIGGNEILGFYYTSENELQISVVNKEITQNRKFFEGGNWFSTKKLTNFFKNKNNAEILTCDLESGLVEKHENPKYIEQSTLFSAIHHPLNQTFVIERGVDIGVTDVW